jgi:hypothetical protein
VDIADPEVDQQSVKDNTISLIEQNHQILTDNLQHYLNNKSATKLMKPSALLTKAERVALFAFQI